MIKITDKKDCCGCTACASICAHQAITMEPDTLGFLYPRVDESKCVACGLCEKVCQFNDHYDLSSNLSKPLAYAARHKKIDEVMASRSGAAFVAISDYIIEHDGVVYGVGFKEHFRVAHKRATTKTERDEFRGSKYVQSDLTGIFSQVKEDLKKGLTVLFTGTPCQTAGLKAYIGKKLAKNLILVDIVCHGVPSPFLWKDYISFLEKKEEDVIQSVNFRDKEEFGWKAHIETFTFTKNTNTKKRYPFKYYQTVSFRQSCNHCHFSNISRPSDITIGDLWGWQKLCPEMNSDDKGLNLLLLNTEKGIIIYDKIKHQLNSLKLQEGTYLQPNLISPTKKHRKRDAFEKDFCKKGISYVVSHHYYAQSLSERIKKRLLSIIKQLKIKS